MKRFTRLQTLFFISFLLFGMMVISCKREPGEMSAVMGKKEKSAWVQEHLLNVDARFPFSFTYGEKFSSDLLKSWEKKVETTVLDRNRTQYTHTWTDNETGLEIRCVSIEYSDYPVVEWVVYFENTGTENTPILKEIQGLDVVFSRERVGEFVLHHNQGDITSERSYEPKSDTLAPMQSKRFAPPGGRPTYGVFPYYNLQMPEGGVFVAIGWPGQWSATFARDDDVDLHVTAGQEVTHLSLQPGEIVRSPLIAQLFWRGEDVQRSHNLWRRWMMEHNLPKTKDGNLLAPQLNACSSHFYNEMIDANEASQKMFIDGYLAKDIKLDYWWMDAGWYPCEGSWGNTGTWEVDTTRFPNGLRAVSDYAHAKGVNIIVWFEPERVGDKNSWLAKTHPEWLLEGTLLNLGNPDVQEWAIKHFSDFITEQGIDLYRQDYNIDPLNYWRNNDTPDRQGITENLYVQGYLTFWDGLIANHPGLLIDACASGGRRNDLETMRRAVPLLRSDFLIEPAGQQGHTYGISSWLPFHGTGVGHTWGGPNLFSAYDFRSCMTPAPNLTYDVRPEATGDWALVTKLCKQWRDISPAMLGDYYPLLPYSIASDAWLAWQFNLPEQGKGIVQAFRREACDESTITLYLRDLDPTARYEVTNLDDDNSTRKVKGKELMEQGLTIEIRDLPGAVVITYHLSK